ncbi:MAG: PAS domain-containing protein [Alphaproteobacteria bacterium]|nr:PAS domain-containing protein [Alphaproteobacteria bacterium]
MEALRSLWESKRRGRAMPARYDFVIDDLAPWLGRLNLISLENGVARFDVFGTHNSREIGIELTGRTVDALPAEDRALANAGIDRAVRERAPVFETVSMVRNQRLRVYDRLILPLSDDGGTVNKMFVLIDSPQDERRSVGRWVSASSARVHAPER